MPQWNANPQRGLRNALNNLLGGTNWLANKPKANVGFRILWCIALVGDFIIDMMIQGVRAAFPGVGTPTAFPYLGASRGILQGYAEPNKNFAMRLINWLTYWRNAGSGEVLAQMIQAYLPNNPRVTIWDRNGNWARANQDGTTSFGKDTNWKWDTVSNPERSGWWSDIWIIVYPDPWPTWNPGGKTGFGYGWQSAAARMQWASKNRNGVGIGHQVPRYAVDGILQIVSTWKGAHTFVQAICWDTTNFLFQPGATLPAIGNPDGTWGNWSVVGRNFSRASRTREYAPFGTNVGHVRYWTPRSGG